MPLHVYVKTRRVLVDDGSDHSDYTFEVWGLVLALPDGATQVGPHAWRVLGEDGYNYTYHGPVPVPGT